VDDLGVFFLSNNRPIFYLIYLVQNDKSFAMTDGHLFVSVGSVIKEIHEAYPDLNTQQIIEIIRAATFNGELDKGKAAELAKAL